MSTETCIVDTEDWQGPGICTVGDVGGGLLAQQIASGGDVGPGYAYSSLSLPADDGKEICGRVTFIPVGLDLATEEDTSGIASAGAEGVYLARWQLYVNQVATGSEKDLEFIFGPVTYDIGYTESSDIVSMQVTVGAPSSVDLDIGYTEESDTVSVLLNVGRVDLSIGYTEAGDTVSIAVSVSAAPVNLEIGYVESSDVVSMAVNIEPASVELAIGYVEAGDIVSVGIDVAVSLRIGYTEASDIVAISITTANFTINENYMVQVAAYNGILEL